MNLHPRHQIRPEYDNNFTRDIAQAGLEIFWFIVFVIVLGIIVLIIKND